MSDPSNTPVNRQLNMALALAKAGYRVFPCKPFSKAPATTNGFYDATTDEDQIHAWFDRPGLNLAIATGDGLLVVDIDPKHDGDITWDELCSHHGTPLAPRHETPSGGYHLFFQAPGLTNTSGRIGKGIDTRGDGGYVLVPHSQLHDDDGEIIRYRCIERHALVTNPPVLLPDWIRTLLETPEAPQPRRDAYIAPRGDHGPADVLREHWSWHSELEHDGWQAERMSGGDLHWVRPGKPIHGGKSATLHPSGAFVVWTSERPAGGIPTRGSDGSTYSPFDYVVAYRCAGNTHAAVDWIRRTYMTAPGGGGTTPAPDPGPVGYGPQAGPTVPVLGEDFWNRRPVLSAIRDAARSRLVSPDALLIATLARWSAMTPPSYKLPPVVGGVGSFDFLGCVVAETSGGKSAANAVARDLVVNVNELVMMDYPVGSGEGLVQSFFVPEMGENDKPTGKQVVGKQALHFSVDEGMALMGQAGRSGTVILPTLCSAWSGDTLGQQNADATRRRVIPAGKVRVACVINMQASNGWRLFEDDVAALGFPGRLLFGSAHDPNAVLDAEMGEPISFPNLPIYGMTGVVLQYDPAITAEIKQRRIGTLTGEVAIEAVKSQHLLLQCKIAGLFTLQDGRSDVSLDDWAIAGELIRVSSETLDAMVSLKRLHDRDRSHALGASIAEREMVAEDIKERQYIAKLAARIRDHCTATPAPNKLARKLCSSDTRHRFEPALALAIHNGWVSVADDAISRL